MLVVVKNLIFVNIFKLSKYMKMTRVFSDDSKNSGLGYNDPKMRQNTVFLMVTKVRQNTVSLMVKLLSSFFNG